MKLQTSPPPRVFGRSPSSGRADRRSGMAMIWVAVSLVMLIGITGLAIDTAYVLYAAHQLQNAADASALAAAYRIRDGAPDAQLAAIDLALENVAAGDPVQLEYNDTNRPNGDIVFGRFDRETRQFKATQDSTSVNAVKVVARRTKQSLGGALPLLFGPAFGVRASNVSRSAVAMIGGGTGGGLIALDNYADCALDVQGTVTLEVNGGDIQVNSESSEGACAGGNSTINAPNINVRGDYQANGSVVFEGNLNPGSPRIEDPLAHIPPPPWDPAADLGTVSIQGGAHQLSPGFYSGGISATGGDITLEPGIYVLDGNGLNITGNTNFTAHGVMFYITGTGYVDLTGSGTISVKPPDPDLYDFEGVVTYEYISIFQDRENTNEARITGTSLLDLEGTLYFSNNHVVLSGTGDGFGNQLIASTIELNGTGDITIEYEGSFPAPGREVFLVQ